MKSRLIRSIFVLGSIILVIVVFKKLRTYQKNKPLCENCNILLISLDTLSAKHLPCYGYDKDTSPNLCQFGKENFLFSNSYSQSNWTRPSQTSVLSGLHASTHGVIAPFVDRLSPRFKTIQETLKENGYTTYYFGPKVDNESWDESVIRGFDYDEKGIYAGQSIHHWQKAMDILKQNQKNKIPTFMYLHTYYVHSPYATGTDNLKFVSKEDIKKYSEIPLSSEAFYALKPEMEEYVVKSLEERIKSSKTSESLKRVTEMLNSFKSGKTFEEKKTTFAKFPGEETQSYARNWYFERIKSLNAGEYIKTLYDERIYQMDKDLKIFFDELSRDFEKDTIVIIYADHGETFGERGSYDHCADFPNCLYNETIRVPLMIKVPGLKSKKIDELAQGIDIYPTIMKLIGKTGPSNLEGEDLVGLMTGNQKKSKKEYIVSEENFDQKVIIDKKWALYFKDTKHIVPKYTELYDLENDLYEQHDLSTERGDIVKIKTDQLNDFVNNNGNINQLKYDFPDWIDEVKKEKLIKEGYF